MSSAATWTPFQPESLDLPSLGGDGTGTVAIVASPGVRGDFSAAAAHGLARALATEGRGVVLVDLCLEDPELHLPAGIPNGEGVSDMLLFGASLRRVAHDVGGGVHLATAGTVAADPAALRASPRWDALVDAFEEAGGWLALYVPAGVAGADALLARADHVVGMRLENEPDEALHLGEAAARLRALVGPPRADATPPHEPAMPEQTAQPVAAPSATSPARDRATAARKPSPGRSPFRLFFIVLALIALVLVLAASLGWIRMPVFTGVDGGSTLAAQEVGGEGRVAAAPSAEWALALESFLDPAVAAGRAEEFQRRHPEVLFWVVPVRVNGRRFHRVLAGQRATEADLEGLRTELGGNPSWYARRVGLAFLLGEVPDLEAARTWTEVLAGLGIPSHVLAVRGPDAGWSYRVFSGGFASPEEASELEDMLRAEQLEGVRLTERRGVVPP